MELTALSTRRWAYMRLACIGRLLNIHDSLASLEYPLLGGSCQATFCRVTPVYSPKRLSLRLLADKPYSLARGSAILYPTAEYIVPLPRFCLPWQGKSDHIKG